MHLKDLPLIPSFSEIAAKATNVKEKSIKRGSVQELRKHLTAPSNVFIASNEGSNESETFLLIIHAAVF